jgi:hypothetical protein
MLSLDKGYSVVTRHLRKLRGGSQPILAQANDNHLYVVKFTNNLQGPNLSFNESMGSELYRTCGLEGPLWKPLLVTDAFLDQNPDCWMQTPEGRLRPSTGMCFGSRFLGGDRVRLLEVLPGTSLSRVYNRPSFWLAWLVDICAGHADNRQAIFRENGIGRLDAFFIDHGHLFGGPKGEQRKHFIASRYLDPRIYQGLPSSQISFVHKLARCLDVDKLWRRVQTLPDDWKAESALAGFAGCLERLSTSRLMEEVVTTMVDAQLQFNDHERTTQQLEQQPSIRFLLPGVQVAEQDKRRGAICGGHSSCAEGCRR